MAASASARLQNVTKPTGCTVPTNKPLVNAQQQNAAGAGVTGSTGRSVPRPKTCGGDALIFAPPPCTPEKKKKINSRKQTPKTAIRSSPKSSAGLAGMGGKDIKRKSRIRKRQKGKREKGKDENEKKKRLGREKKGDRPDGDF